MVDGLVGRCANTVSSELEVPLCELEVTLTNNFGDRHLDNSLIKSLVCYKVSRLFDIQHNPIACPFKDVKFLGKCLRKYPCLAAIQ